MPKGVYPRKRSRAELSPEEIRQRRTEYNRRFYQKHKNDPKYVEAHRAQRKRWVEKNPERDKEIREAWRKKNKEKIKEAARQRWRTLTPEKRAEINKRERERAKKNWKPCPICGEATTRPLTCSKVCSIENHRRRVERYEATAERKKRNQERKARGRLALRILEQHFPGVLPNNIEETFECKQS